MIENLESNEFQRLRKSDEPEGAATIESKPLEFLYAITHDRYETSVIIEGPPLDDCDAVPDYRMRHIFRNSLVIETVINIKFHRTFYFLPKTVVNLIDADYKIQTIEICFMCRVTIGCFQV